MPPKGKNPEDSYSKTVDMCLSDAIVKGGGGLLLGTLASVVIIKRRWPITTGLGIGLGFSLANCQWTWCNRNSPQARK